MSNDFDGLAYNEEAWPDERIVQELRHLGVADSRRFMFEAAIELRATKRQVDGES